jgi:AraC family transcriptional regulator, exoenzyme S synthesis regulatory protein ExsA
MRITEITSCYIGPQISPEQFIPEHFFLYLGRGVMKGFDGIKEFNLNAGDYCIVCKNHLARYNKQKDDGQFEKVVIIFDEPFLREFKQKHAIADIIPRPHNAFIALHKHELIPNFIASLMPYYSQGGQIDDTFSIVKREELLLILLKINPEIVSVLFDFGIPEKIDLEAYMNRNYKFNVSLDRFAYLTGRSLSSFKRDFKHIFKDPPSRWLIKRRLQEAHFLIQKKACKPIEFYLDLGFEDLSHFSYTFKKEFGYSPTELLVKKV